VEAIQRQSHPIDMNNKSLQYSEFYRTDKYHISDIFRSPEVAGLCTDVINHRFNCGQERFQISSQAIRGVISLKLHN
jgi:hypothetical protein